MAKAKAKTTTRKRSTKKAAQTKTTSTAVSKLKCWYIGITFRNYHQTYTYMSYNENIMVGDKVVVDSPSDGLVVVDVVRVSDMPHPKATKWIVDKVDVAAYEDQMAREAYKEVLKLELEKRRRELDQRAKDDYYAQQDETFAQLLQEFRSM